MIISMKEQTEFVLIGKNGVGKSTFGASGPSASESADILERQLDTMSMLFWSNRTSRTFRTTF